MEKNTNSFKESFNLFLDTLLNPIHSTKHKCNLNEKLDALKQRYPGNSIKEKFLRCFYLLFISNKKIKCLKHYYESQYEIYCEQKLQLYTKHFIIHPDSIFSETWNIFMFCLSFNILFIYPLVWSIAIVRMHCRIFQTVMAVSEIFSMINIFINFFTAFYTDEKLLCLNIKKIVIHYLRNQFLIDVIVALPINLLSTICSPNTKTRVLLYDNGFYDFLFFIRIVKYIPFVYSLHVFLKYFIKHKSIYLFVQAQIGFILFIHWITCLIIIFSSFDAEIEYKYKSYEIKNWLTINNRWNTTSFNYLYGTALLKALSNTFNIEQAYKWKYIRTHEKAGNYETAFAVFTSIISQFVFYLYICVVYEAYRIKHTRKNRLVKLTKILKLYLDRKQYDPLLKKRIIIFLNERSETYLINNEITRNMTILNAYNLLKRLDLFQSFQKAILTKLATCLISETYLPGDFIERTDTALHFILHGSVVLYFSDATEIKHLEDGDYFGHVNLLSNIVDPDYITNRVYVAIEVCTILHLPTITFKNFISSYPDLLQRLISEVEYIKNRDLYYYSTYTGNRNDKIIDVFNL